MPGRAFIGTSGFAYLEWKGVFYPPDTRGDAMLRYYATRLGSLEINYTYRRDPSEKMLAKWAADTPGDFAFALKGHRRITDQWRRDPTAAEPLERFLELIAPLGSRIGPVLIQGPHNLKAAPGMLEAFLPLLPDGRRFAFDFRHASWRTDEVRDLVRAHGAAWCIADTDDQDAAFDVAGPGFAYVRLRKSAYDDETLARWAHDFRDALDRGIDVYCYFRHADGDGGRGVGYAQRMRDLLAAGPR